MCTCIRTRTRTPATGRVLARALYSAFCHVELLVKTLHVKFTCTIEAHRGGASLREPVTRAIKPAYMLCTDKCRTSSNRTPMGSLIEGLVGQEVLEHSEGKTWFEGGQCDLRLHCHEIELRVGRGVAGNNTALVLSRVGPPGMPSFRWVPSDGGNEALLPQYAQPSTSPE